MFPAIYLISGAAALLYEVLWLRLLTLSMGHTAGAVGILLAAFMAGLAFGAWRAGRTAASMAPRRALRAYAVLEAAIAASALILPALLAWSEPVLRAAYADGTRGPAFAATRGAIAFILLSVPAAAMGATYPLAVRWVGDAARGAAQYAGGLYAANTAGAALGAAVTGFLLLPALGAFGTTLVGVALNLIAASGALFIARSHADVGAALRRPMSTGRLKPAPTIDIPTSDTPLRIAAAALAVSGMVSLIFQVTWTRLLAMVLGPTTYAFSAMLVAVIAGLAIGSACAAALAPRDRSRAAMWLGRVLVAAAAAGLAASFTVDRLPLILAAAVTRPDVTFESVFTLQVGLAIALQLPMTIALGAAFPLAIAMAAPGDETAPRDVSIVYAANTCGAIAGALGASFLLIPALGIQTSIRLAAAAAAAAGIVIPIAAQAFMERRQRALYGMALAGAIVLVAAATMPAWNLARLANGGYRYASALATGDLVTGLEAGRLVYYREGAAGTVSVRQVPGALSLAIDGKVDASNAADMLTQKLLAHLPLLLHANPRRVCVIGLGSGVTLGAALTHPIERADVIEISPEVVEASALFASENHRALDDPRTRLIVGDGRTHLLLSQDRYDVIISEPSNPWMAGVAALFTREFFLAARARLAPGGLLTQWAHTYSISDADLRSIVATFLSVFPDGTAWLVGESDLLLVGGTEPIAALTDGIAPAWGRPGVAADLADVAARDPFSVLTLLVGAGPDLQRYAAGADIQADDDMRLEYSAPRAIYGQFQQSNVARLREVAGGMRQPLAVADALRTATAAEWRNRGLMQLRADAPALAYDDLREAVVRQPTDPEALRAFARAAASAGRLADAEQLLADLVITDGPGGTGRPIAPALVELSVVRAARGQVDEATRAARDAVVADPMNPAALRQLASMYGDAGDDMGLDRLMQVIERAGVDPGVMLYAQMRHAYARGEFARTVERGDQLVARDEGDVNVFNLIASAHAALGQYDRARQALESARSMAPTDPGVLVNLGTVALRAGDASTAADRFSDALFLSPTLPAARAGLADAYDRQGNRDRAAALRAGGGGG